MASYTRVGKQKRWRVQVYKNGLRKAKTFDFKSDANEWARKIEAELTTADTVQEALRRYIRYECPKHKGEHWEKLRLNRLMKELPCVRLCELSSDDLATWRNTRLKTVSGPTVKREMNLLNQVFNVALREWGWLNTNPMTKIKKPEDSRPRRRGIPAAVIPDILSALSYQPEREVMLKKQEVAVAFLFAIETAMRLGEILALRKRDVDILNKVVTVADSKNKDTRKVPLSTMAIKLLRVLPLLYSGKQNTRIFTVQAGSASSIFRKAKNGIDGCDDLHFHDSRSEGLTRLSRKFSVIELARVVGHRSPASLMIYYAPSIEDLANKLD